MDKKRVLVYGATGFQGSPVARRLLEEGEMGDVESLRAAGEKKEVGI